MHSSYVSNSTCRLLKNKIAGSFEKPAVFVICFFVGMFFFSSRSYAQSGIDSATRESDVSYREKVERMTRPKPTKPALIKEEPTKKVPEGPTFFIKTIILEGCESYPPEEFASIVSKYENKEGSLEDLNILAKEIARDYIRRGKIAACFVPPQDAKGGVFKLQVVESHMAELEIHDYEYYRVYSTTFKTSSQTKVGKFFDRFFKYSFFKYDRDVLKNYWTIEPGDVLSYDKMSRILQRMNKNPDRNVNATIHAGTKPKTSNILLEEKTRFPIHLTMGFDTEGTPATGKQRKSAGIRDNNFLFADDTLIYGYTYGTSFSGSYVYHRVPITNMGTNVMYGWNLSKSAPKKQYTPSGISSRTENASFFVYQDIFNKATYLGEVYTGLDAKDKTVKQTTGIINRDRLRILRFGGNFVWEGFGGVTYISPELSQGINCFGARRKRIAQFDAVPTSRDSSNTPTKATYDFTHKRPLPWMDMQIAVKSKGQWASEKLASQEQMFLGGIDSVRGYPSGDFLADSGVQANFELLIPAFMFPDDFRLPYANSYVKNDLTGVIFYDYAHGERRGGTESPTEKTQVFFSSMGCGFRYRCYNQLLVRLELGVPIGADRPITESSQTRIHFSLSFEDKLPEEIERIMAERAQEDIQRTAWALVNEEINKPENSNIRQEINEFVKSAKIAQNDGEYMKAEEYYARVDSICKKLYEQAERYVKESLEQLNKLREYRESAMDFYYRNELEKSKEMWEKVVEASKIQPLFLEVTL
ncbi:MAG: ShlB/FhaC/HecB family hemolysin secretion/activation protein [Candidatus Omnitrophica bacterium]|nr:ShlB/FhaC/HecB family hemolysin secretion/activation protein [Candidatus Omnitrophota bacterium]